MRNRSLEVQGRRQVSHDTACKQQNRSMAPRPQKSIFEFKSKEFFTVSRWQRTFNSSRATLTKKNYRIRVLSSTKRLTQKVSHIRDFYIFACGVYNCNAKLILIKLPRTAAIWLQWLSASDEPRLENAKSINDAAAKMWTSSTRVQN